MKSFYGVMKKANETAESQKDMRRYGLEFYHRDGTNSIYLRDGEKQMILTPFLYGKSLPGALPGYGVPNRMYALYSSNERSKENAKAVNDVNKDKKLLQE